jgi:8-oxo-dGTP diphosphatase
MENYELFGAQGIIYDKEKKEVVLVKRKRDNLWVIPGGMIDEGETPEQACIREVFEEAGLRVEIIGLVGIYRRPNREAWGKKGDEARVYLCRELGGGFKENDEISEMRRFKVDALPHDIASHHIERIRDAVNYNGTHVERISY